MILDKISQAIEDVYKGKPIKCKKVEYFELRHALQKQAGIWIDQGQDMIAQIAIQEVKRLDEEFK